MNQIRKYQITRDQEIPEGAKILHLAYQRGTLHIWALVDPDRPSKIRKFFCCGTGEWPMDNLVFIGSVMDCDSMWHYFISAE